MSNVRFETDGPVAIVTIDRPKVRNCVDGHTARELADAFRRFEADDALSVAVLTGADGCFCAGADLKALSAERSDEARQKGLERMQQQADGPLGPTRFLLSKPTIAAVEGHAVAGGLELAIWCDLRVAAEDAVFGVFCRRWGVPLVDGGTIRLSRMLGHSHALDLILTGRGVSGDEARLMGLANRIVPTGEALSAALELARQLAAFPQLCLRNDRRSSYDQWALPLDDAIRREFELGMAVLRSGETLEGAKRFAAGSGRHGSYEDL